MDLETHIVEHSQESPLVPKLLSIPLPPMMLFECCFSVIFSGRGERSIFWIRRVWRLGESQKCIQANLLAIALAEYIVTRLPFDICPDEKARGLAYVFLTHGPRLFALGCFV